MTQKQQAENAAARRELAEATAETVAAFGVLVRLLRGEKSSLLICTERRLKR